MTRRHPNFAGLLALLVLLCGPRTGLSSSLRETPAVRAVRRVRASVVNIHTVKVTQPTEGLFSVAGPRKVNGMGTGIIIDERGYVVTNLHVVDAVESIRATLFDGSTYQARVLASNREHDLAILKIEPSAPLQVMPLGTSSDLMLGETVLAVGNAFGYEHTVTAGIVSALSRDVEVNEHQSYKSLIQTDASINPGNSGGPLLNLDGEVVGINVAIRAGAQRIGFAIPIDHARKVVADLLNEQILQSVYHGIIARDAKSAGSLQLVVDTVEPESPAAAAGIQPGDVLLRVDDIAIQDGVDWARGLLGHRPGDEVAVSVRRGDEKLAVRLTLGAVRSPDSTRRDELIVRANNGQGASEQAWQQLGLKLAPVPANTVALLAPRYRGGMRVVAVRPDSPAARNGIRPGDILVGLHIWETIRIDNVAYVLDHHARRPTEPLKFYILRGHETLFGHLTPAPPQR